MRERWRRFTAGQEEMVALALAYGSALALVLGALAYLWVAKMLK